MRSHRYLFFVFFLVGLVHLSRFISAADTSNDDNPLKDEKKLNQMFLDLDADDFRLRLRTANEFAEMGNAILPWLKKKRTEFSRRSNPSPEVFARLNDIFDSIRNQVLLSEADLLKMLNRDNFDLLEYAAMENLQKKPRLKKETLEYLKQLALSGTAHQQRYVFQILVEHEAKETLPILLTATEKSFTVADAAQQIYLADLLRSHYQNESASLLLIAQGIANGLFSDFAAADLMLKNQNHPNAEVRKKVEKALQRLTQINDPQLQELFTQRIKGHRPPGSEAQRIDTIESSPIIHSFYAAHYLENTKTLSEAGIKRLLSIPIKYESDQPTMAERILAKHQAKEVLPRLIKRFKEGIELSSVTAGTFIYGELLSKNFPNDPEALQILTQAVSHKIISGADIFEPILKNTMSSNAEVRNHSETALHVMMQNPEEEIQLLLEKNIPNYVSAISESELIEVLLKEDVKEEIGKQALKILDQRGKISDQGKARLLELQKNMPEVFKREATPVDKALLSFEVEEGVPPLIERFKDALHRRDQFGVSSFGSAMAPYFERNIEVAKLELVAIQWQYYFGVELIPTLLKYKKIKDHPLRSISSQALWAMKNNPDYDVQSTLRSLKVFRDPD